MNPTRLQKSAFSLVDRLFEKISIGHLVLTLPDGTEKQYGDDSTPVHVKVHSYAFFSRLVTDGDIGLGESWTAGDWTSDELYNTFLDSETLSYSCALFQDADEPIAETLRRWRRAFEENKQELLQKGYDDMFQRKWVYYFTYCEVGFQTRLINELQLVIRKAHTNAQQAESIKEK